MTYKTPDFYSDEAKATVNTLNAIEGQLLLKYASRLQRADVAVANPYADDPGTDYLRGFKDALCDVTHAAGTLAGLLNNAERQRLRERDEHESFGL